jgi:hypothetical protein
MMFRFYDILDGFVRENQTESCVRPPDTTNEFHLKKK